jgi:hypothetical protein
MSQLSQLQIQQLQDNNRQLIAKNAELKENIDKYQEFFAEIESGSQMKVTILRSVTIANQVDQGVSMAFQVGVLDPEAATINWQQVTENKIAGSDGA